MKSETLGSDHSRSPFIFRYAEILDCPPTQLLRYDQLRQISQVFIDGAWIDTPDAESGVFESSRLTRVRPETSDEE